MFHGTGRGGGSGPAGAALYHLLRAVPAADLASMRRTDELRVEYPFADTRMLRGPPAAGGHRPGVLMSRL